MIYINSYGSILFFTAQIFQSGPVGFCFFIRQKQGIFRQRLPVGFWSFRTQHASFPPKPSLVYQNPYRLCSFFTPCRHRKTGATPFAHRRYRTIDFSDCSARECARSPAGSAWPRRESSLPTRAPRRAREWSAALNYRTLPRAHAFCRAVHRSRARYMCTSSG